MLCNFKNCISKQVLRKQLCMSYSWIGDIQTHASPPESAPLTDFREREQVTPGSKPDLGTNAMHGLPLAWGQPVPSLS